MAVQVQNLNTIVRHCLQYITITSKLYVALNTSVIELETETNKERNIKRERGEVNAELVCVWARERERLSDRGIV